MHMSLLETLGFDPNYQYSTMMPGGLDQRVNYNGVECIWGLREKGMTPSLVHPRPRIVFKQGGEIYDESRDFVMHRCIMKETPEDIIEAMFDRTKVFVYDGSI